MENLSELFQSQRVDQNYKVSLLEKNQKDQIIELRTVAYKKKYDTQNLNTALLSWNDVDELSLHYAIYCEGDNHNPASIMRLTLGHDLQIFKKIMLYDFDARKWSMPYAILSRAATHPKYESLGLNMILRNFLIPQIFDQNLSVNIFGLVAMDVQRLVQLKNMGYQTIENPQPWNGCIKRPGHSSYVVVLNKRAWQSAQQMKTDPVISK